jgi:CRP-like cAMP-binding protein
MDNLELLQNLYLFQRLDVEELKEVMSLIYEKVYASGTKIFEEGSTGSTMYIVKSGLVQIVKQRGDTEDTIATLMEGDFFGEMVLFDIAPRSATARAGRDTALLEISKEQFDSFVEQRPQIAAKILYAMMEEMVRRLRRKVSEADHLLLP